MVIRGLLEDDKGFLDVCDNRMRLFGLESEVLEGRLGNDLELSGLYTNVLLLLLMLYLAAARGMMKSEEAKAMRAMRGTCIQCLCR